eukprot:530867_1
MTTKNIVSRLDSLINAVNDIAPSNKSSSLETNDIKNDDNSNLNKQDAPRVTELPNDMSGNIDICSPLEILHILRTCDSQIFSGWHEYSNIYDFIPIINIIIHHLKDILSDTNSNKIILSGCGTSGRLGWIICRIFNEYLIKHNYTPCFDYCLSGYDKALLTSQELWEDDPKTGVKDLLQRTKGAKKVLLIGITCGLSAPYVGGQIEYAMKQNNYITVLMGFNPAHLSRNRPVEKWNGQTFRNICMNLNKISPKPNDIINYNNKLPTQILLNPIIGPEAITGSSRMKGGSITTILLNIIFIIGFYQIENKNNININNNKDLNQMIYDLLIEFENIYRESYSYKHLNKLSNICKLSGNSLQNDNGRVIYYGGMKPTTLISFIDASEMEPTYGTPLQRYRSYFNGGWKFLKNKQGDLSYIDERFKIETKYLNVSTLTTNDVVIFIGNVKFPNDLNRAKCKFARVLVGEFEDIQEDFESVCMKLRLITGIRKMIEINCNKLLYVFDDLCNMFSMKLLLNGISTAGHVLSGSVLNNRMINVRSSNDKLFYRSIGMIQEFGNVSFEIGKQCMLMSIYGENQYKEKENDLVSNHIIAATPVDRIVPVAILLAAQISQQIKVKKTIKEIRNILNNEPSIRKVLKDFCK